MNNEWEKEFEEWMEKHDDMCGGLDSSQVASLKSFIRDLLKEQEEDIRLLTEEIEHLRADLDSLTPTKTDKQV